MPPRPVLLSNGVQHSALAINQDETLNFAWATVPYAKTCSLLQGAVEIATGTGGALAVPMPQVGSYPFALKCSSPDGKLIASDTVLVTVQPVAAPNPQLFATLGGSSPPQQQVRSILNVIAGSKVAVSWPYQATATKGCLLAQDGKSISTALGGSTGGVTIAASTQFKLSCSGIGGTGTFTVQIGICTDDAQVGCLSNNKPAD